MRLVNFLILFCAFQLFGGCRSPDSTTGGTTSGSQGLNVPREAREVRESTGQISYFARRDGRLWLYDVEDRNVIDSRAIRRNQEYTLVPAENKIEVDGRTVSERDLKKSHTHRLYFLPDDRGELSTGDRRMDDRLPRDATRVADGKGELSFRARDDGRVYVYDEDADKVLLDRRLRRDERILVDPTQDQITVDGRKVFDRNLESKHSHRIYFEKD